MKIIKTISELKENRMSSKSFPLGLVPTMGALHEGHLSLAHSAIAACPEIIVSIFVNPTQFNDKNDLEKYPRTMEKDKDLLGTVLRKNDIIFAPEVHEIYPEEDKRKFSFGNLDNVMEALHRPGHFNGVAQIVSKLFSITEPDIAFFGMKDFQQLAVIKDLVRQMNSRIQIVSCPIIRENDGLAMSSRNALLEKHVREKAPVIFKTISEAAGMITSKDIPKIREFVAHKINSIRDFNVEYFEIADDVELIPVNAKRNMIPGRKYYCCIAVKAGKIRLIDNIEISVKM